jgi:hypothetical protein
MAHASVASDDLATLASTVIYDAGKLVAQQVDVLCAEVRQELRQMAGGAAALAAGGGLAAAAGLLSGLMSAHLLHRTTRLPLWSCYGLAAAALGAAGAALLQTGASRLATVPLLPQTTQAVAENVAWLKEQIHPANP